MLSIAIISRRDGITANRKQIRGEGRDSASVYTLSSEYIAPFSEGDRSPRYDLTATRVGYCRREGNRLTDV
ncbi:hypothetical protein D3C71_1827300 [compost metagenome]